MTRRLALAPPSFREAMLLSALWWLAPACVMLPAALLAGQITGLGEVASMGTGYLSSVALVTLLYLLARAVVGWLMLLAIPAVVAGVTAVAGLQTLADYAGQYLLHLAFAGHRMPDTSAQSMLTVGSVYWALSACNLGLFWASSAARRLRAQQDAAMQAELTMLRLQLDPHFMGNSLNAVSSLILSGRGEQAARMAERLADFLRLSTELRSAETRLSDELGTVDAYLEVEWLRFGDRLLIDVDVAPDAGDAAVPNFILQPLVENALKYGVARTAGPVTLRIVGTRNGDALVLSVENRGEWPPGPPPPAKPGGGVGLANIRARLAMLHGAAAALETQALPDGYRATIRLPFRAVA